MYTVSTKITPSLENRRVLLSSYVAQGKINTTTQLDYALEYLEQNISKPEIDIGQFEKAAGVGV